MSAREDAVKAAMEALALIPGTTVTYPMSVAATVVGAAAPHLLAAHEAEVRAKVAAEQAAWECLDPWVCCVGAHYDSVHNPTTTEADA